MRKLLTTFLLFCFAAVPAFAQTDASPSDAEALLKAMRGDMQASKAAILGKNMALSSTQAAKFWPMYEAYQKEQGLILDAQLKGIKEYVDKYDGLTDAAAVALMDANFARDAKMNELRKKWMPEFTKVLGTKLAVRAMQIDRRLSMAQQFEMSTHIPLSHD